MKIRKVIGLLLAAALAAALLTGCTGRKDAGKGGRIAISMYMWDRSMLKGLSP